MNQRVVALAGFHEDVAALAAVAARGPSAGDKLLAPEGDAAVAAITSLYADCGFVDEHEKDSHRDTGTERKPNALIQYIERYGGRCPLPARTGRGVRGDRLPGLLDHAAFRRFDEPD